MKRMLISSAFLCPLIFCLLSFTSTAANYSQKHKAVARFDSPVALQGVVLKGDYLFVHDDTAMTRGDACTFVYQGDAEVASKLVASFHCIPVIRAKAREFVVRSVEVAPGFVEIREYQFAGDTEGHAVPIAATVK